MTEIGYDDRSINWSGESAGTTGPGAGPQDSQVPRGLLDDRLLATIARTIQFEIVPRLLMATRDDRQQQVLEQPESAEVSAAEVDRFVEMVMSTDVQVAFVTVRALQDRGVPSATIFLSLLAPTARRLGDMWLSDQCSFADVTMGLVRLQQIMRGLSASVPRLTHRSHRQPSILLMRYANEQHTLGLSVVREMFQDAGWRTDLVTISRSDEAGQLLEDEWYDVVGVSLSNDDLLGPLASAISLLRRRSQNQAISVLVGGAAFNGQPGRGALVGADGAPEDGREAVRLANVLTGMEAAEVTGQS